VVDGDSGERGREPARETAGLAKKLEEVKYAAVITKPTARSPVAVNLIFIDDMMDKLNLLRPKASALGFSIEGADQILDLAA
jgi:hypothetical protein